MLTTNQLRILAGLALLLALALGVRAWLLHRPAAHRPAVLPSIEDARKLAAGRSQVVPLAAPSLADRWWPGFGYTAIEADLAGQKDLGAFFLGIHDPHAKAIAVSASVTFGDGAPLPLIPLALLVEHEGGYRPAYVADGRLTPFMPMGDSHQASLTLDVAYLDDAPDDLIAAAKAVAVAAVGLHPGRLGAASAGYRARLAERHGPSLAALVSPSLSAEAPAIRVSLQGGGGLAVGGMAFKMTVATPVLVDPAARGLPAIFDALASLGLGEGEVENLSAGNAASVGDACGALRARLADDLGLGPVDGTIALWALANRAAVFASPGVIDACFDEAGRTRLNALALAPPKTLAAPPSEARVKAWHEAAVQALTPAGRDKGRAKLSKLMSSLVLLDGTAAVPAAPSGARLAPAVGQAEALDFLDGLPVSRVSCAWRAADAARAGLLLTLENDGALYRLDAAFDEDGAVNGLRIDEAAQDDFCRALKRRPADGPCLFAGQRAKFRNLDPRACGKAG